MTPRIVVRTFGPGPRGMWDRLVHVLAYTARRHCPAWRQDFASVAAPPITMKESYAYNTSKLQIWHDLIQQAADGDEILLLDADTAILRPLDEVWARPFDIAYTAKQPGAGYELNGGVIFVRVSEAARDFMARWLERNLFFLDNPLELQLWLGAFGGLNQAALGWLLDRKKEQRHHAKICKLPCLEWNLEDDHWGQFDPALTRILHVKSSLQSAIFKMTTPEDDVRPLVKLWRQLEQDSIDPQQPPNVDLDRTHQITPDTLENQIIRPVDLDTPLGPPVAIREPSRRTRKTSPGGRDGYA